MIPIKPKAEAHIPPTPRGCEWRKADDGWNLWRHWTEKDPSTGEKVRKLRYAGFLTNESWEKMKDYPYETFISIISQRLRRYGQGNTPTEQPFFELPAGPIPPDQDEEKRTKNGSNWALPRKSAKSSKSKRLDVQKSGTKEQPVWTVKTPRGKSTFRVRKNDSGNRVMLRFKSESGQGVESYCCYLSDEEWGNAQKRTLAYFSELILRKLAERRANESNDLDKIDALILRVRSIAEG